MPLPIGLAAPRTFASYTAGENAEALAHLQALEAGAAPVYLWGPSGSGKTHLLEALAHRFRTEGRRSGWFGAGEGVPWTLDDEACSLVVIDRCDALDAAEQQAAFGTFIAASTRRLSVVAAGRVPPVDLPLREDLRTRLGWGHVYALRPLGEPETRDALLRLAERRGIPFSAQVVDYLLTRDARDLKHLVQQLDRLDAYSLATRRPVTVPLLKQMLAEAGRLASAPLPGDRNPGAPPGDADPGAPPETPR